MLKFTVHLLGPLESWENIEAKDADEAIAICKKLAVSPQAFDCNEVTSWLACCEDEE